MKRLMIFSPLLVAAAGLIQGARVEVNPGELADYIATLSNDVTNLKVVGNIDARDLAALRNLPASVLELNLQESRVVAYSGAVEAFPGRERFAADELPEALFYQSNFRSIYLPAGVARMGEALCAGSAALEEVVVSEGTTQLAPYALNNCSSLTTLLLPESLESMGRYSLAGCSSLESLSMSHTKVTDLPDALFKGCSSLASVELPTGIKVIGSEILAGSAVTELSLPALEKGGAYALAGIPTLRSVTVSPTAGYGEGFLADNPSLVSVSGSPAAIPDLFLANTPGTDPSGLLSGASSAGEYSFANNAVRTLFLGADINFIDAASFAGAGQLQAISATDLGDRIPEVAENAFSRLDPSKVGLHVTEESVSLWKEHPVWGLFNVRTDDIGVREVGTDGNITINVSGGVLNVSAPAGIAFCDLYTQDGVRVATARNAGIDYTVDMSEFPTKMAVVTVESGDGARRSVKLLVR